MAEESRVSKLARKLAEAREAGDDERATKLRRKLKEAKQADAEQEAEEESAVIEPVPEVQPEVDAELEARVAKARRKLEKAEQSGDQEEIAKRREKLQRLTETAEAEESRLSADHKAMHQESAKSYQKDTKAAASTASSSLDPVKVAAGLTELPATENPDEWVKARSGKWFPKPGTPAFQLVYGSAPKGGNTSLLLFYAYVKPLWSGKQRADVIEFTHDILSKNGCTGRLRVALEGFNSTLTGPPQGIRNFCDALREFDPVNFGKTDFKIVDGMADNKAFRNLKVFPVTELVTYGIPDIAEIEAKIENGGIHVKPDEWTRLAAQPNTVMIDVRNANESAIGWFQPPPGGAELLDPRMRRSTEFPQWIEDNREKLEGKHVMMYCTAGIRCERASALLASRIKALDVTQLEGGIHRYLDAYEEDGGIWVGKNYTFDKRFAHGSKKSDVVSHCSSCKAPWERYQAQVKCSICRMECLLCRECERRSKTKGAAPLPRLLCWLCAEVEEQAGTGNGAAAAAAAAKARKAAKAFAAAGGGRDGEGEGAAAMALNDAEEDDYSGGGGGASRGGFGGRGRGRGGRF